MNPEDPPGELDEIPPEYRQETSVTEHKSVGRRFLDEVLTDRVRLLSLCIVLGVALTAVLAPFIAPHDPDQTHELFQPPGSESVGDFDGDGSEEQAFHLLGTDSFGHDILSRVIFGARISLLVALSTVALAGVVGTGIGLVAGYFGGWVDNALMRYIDFQWAFPEIVLAIAIIAFLGGLGLVNVIIAIGLAFLDDFARIVRGEVLSIREKEYIKSAKTIGMSDTRIMVREVLPNATAPMIVQATVLFPLAILAESALSFLGLGVEPTTPTWGLLISEGRGFITSHWWIAVMPGIAIMVTALSFNVLGDALRDMYDVSNEDIDR
jgi:peptide/nickel transport system permease protein